MDTFFETHTIRQFFFIEEYPISYDFLVKQLISLQFFDTKNQILITKTNSPESQIFER